MSDYDKFMKTEEPSQHRLKQARNKGYAPVAREFGAGLIIICSILVLKFTGKTIISGFIELFAVTACSADELLWSEIGHNAIIVFFKMVLPVMVVSFTAAFISQVVQKGFIFTIKPFSFNLKREKRKIFSWSGALNGLKSLLEIICAGLIIFFNIRIYQGKLVSMWNQDVIVSMNFTFSLLMDVGLEIGVFFLIVSVPEYLYQRHRLRMSLRMTRQEALDEARMLGTDEKNKKLILKWRKI